ncbi:MAG: helix-turn-helix transcriptional regulator [Vicinamibacterales bacterium]
MKVSESLSDTAVLVELGTRLAASRLAKNLTQEALAETAGISKRTLERLESGSVATRLSAFVRVSRALGILNRLGTLVPSPSVSPVEQLKLAGRRRKRASGRATTKPPKRWTWGNES